jgi:hypothetical protein
LSRIAVRPFEPTGATGWEQELFELTSRRGLPVFHRATVGRDTSPDGCPELEEAGRRFTCFASSPGFGPVYITAPEPATAAARRGLWSPSRRAWLAYDWRDWIERLAVLESMPEFPPAFIVHDPWRSDGRSNLRDRFIPALGLRQEALREPRSALWLGDETLVLGGYPHETSLPRVYASRSGALTTALRAAEAAELPWYFPSVDLPPGELRTGAGPVVGALQRRAPHATLRVTVSEDVVCQEIDVLGSAVEIAQFTRGNSVRKLVHGAPPGSARVAAWALRRGVVRCPVQLDDDGVMRWLTSRRMPRWRALAGCERAFGGVLSTGSYGEEGSDPLSRPKVVLGVGLIESAPEALVARWSTALNNPDAPLVGMSCFLEPPRARDYLLWGWRQQTFLFVGEWFGRYLFCDENGVIHCFHEDGGELEVIAGAPGTLLEQIAIKEQLWRELGDFVTVHVFADTGAEVARRLGLQRVEEACDDLIQTYEGSGLLIQQRRAYGPSFLEMRVVSGDLEAMVRAVREARSVCPDAAVRVWESSTEARAHVAALVNAGMVSADESDGPGIGEPTRFESNATDDERDPEGD